MGFEVREDEVGMVLEDEEEEDEGSFLLGAGPPSVTALFFFTLSPLTFAPSALALTLTF